MRCHGPGTHATRLAKGPSKLIAGAKIDPQAHLLGGPA